MVLLVQSRRHARAVVAVRHLILRFKLAKSIEFLDCKKIFYLATS